jgi:RNA polymerase sigma-70 factor (ECF subfamily)
MIEPQTLLDRAQSGDDQAFAELVQPYRRELHVHCYRMLGSFDDADDAMQEVLLAAWRGLPTFAARSSVRTWLYRVATNTSLNLLRAGTRRPQTASALPDSAPEPTGAEKVTWLQPYPDTLLDALPDQAPGPEARIEQDEAVSLAFVTALQHLSPRARAVLILRDVLGFTARETAGTLGSTEEAVAMTLSRARAALRGTAHQTGPDRARLAAVPPAGATLVQRLAAAFSAHDVDAVVRMLAQDVRIAMPPLPAVWQGRQRAAEFLAGVVFRLVPEARFIETSANRQPALAVYTRDEVTGRWRGNGLLVVTLRGAEVAGLTRFESHILRSFGLPLVLADDGSGLGEGTPDRPSGG